MTVLRYFFKRLRALWRPDDIHDEISEEMRFHIELRAEENVRRGMAQGEARRKAEQQFGRLDRIKEEGYDVRGGRWLEAAWQDLRYGARMLLKSKGFTAVAVLSLALGIGANTAIFSVIDAAMLRTLPVERPERLALFSRLNPQGGGESFTYPQFAQFRERNQVFANVFGFAYRQPKVNIGGREETALVQIVTGQYFPSLGVKADLGQTLAS